MRAVRSLLLALAMMAFFSGCATTSATHAPTSTPGASIPQPDRLEVTRFSNLNRFPPFDVVVSNSAKAQEVYAGLLALPPQSYQGPYCAGDDDINYRLVFSRKDVMWPAIIVHASGCGYVLVSAADRRNDTLPFLQTLARVLGVSLQDLTAPPGQPLITASPTPTP